MADKGKALVAGGVLVGLGFLATKAFAGKGTPSQGIAAKGTGGKTEAVTLGVQYAKEFGVPSSLVLATLKTESDYRRSPPDKHLNNGRGGAWGYGQMTFKTAQDLAKRYPTLTRKSGWDGTPEGLEDANVNVMFSAFYLSLLWKKYRKAMKGNMANPWLAAGIAYHDGPGNVDKLLKANGMQLPEKLSGNTAIVANRLVATQTDDTIKKAIVNDKPAFSAIPAA